jgi:hypothetical protein
MSPGDVGRAGFKRIPLAPRVSSKVIVGSAVLLVQNYDMSYWMTRASNKIDLERERNKNQHHEGCIYSMTHQRTAYHPETSIKAVYPRKCKRTKSLQDHNRASYFDIWRYLEDCIRCWNRSQTPTKASKINKSQSQV